MNSPHFAAMVLVAMVLLLAWVLYRIFPRRTRNVLRFLDRWSGVAILSLGILVFVFGCLGFGEIEERKIDSIPIAIYETFQIFAFNSSKAELQQKWQLQVSMLCAILLASLVAVKGIALLFHDSYEAISLKSKSNHSVVCGLGRIGRQLVADLAEKLDPAQIVVIEPDPENPNIEWARRMAVIVIVADATRNESLLAARVHRAKEVFVVTGSDNCNIESVIEIRDILQKKQRINWFWRPLPRLNCHVHILDRDLAEIVRSKANELERHQECASKVDVEVFNALERTAGRLLEDIARTCYRNSAVEHQKERGGQSEDSVICERPSVGEGFHFFMLGFGTFGQTLALKLAELAHFGNDSRLRMTIVDDAIQSKAKPFLARYPSFCSDKPINSWRFESSADQWESKDDRPSVAAKLPDGSPGIEYVCNARFVEYSDVADHAFISKLVQSGSISGIRPIILVCFEDDRENFARSERLKIKLQQKGVHWPILVWIPRQRELSQLLSEKTIAHQEDSKVSCKVVPFGQCYGSVSYEEITNSWIDWLARHLHLVWMQANDPLHCETVSQLQRSLDSDDFVEGMANLNWSHLASVAKQSWEHCNEWERASNRSSAVSSVLKAGVLGRRIVGLAANPTREDLRVNEGQLEILRRMEHYRWVSERLLAGWRYDERRSDLAKTRWQLTPWNGLETPPKSVVAEAKAKSKTLNEKKKDDRIVRLVVGLILLGLFESKPLSDISKF